MNSGSDQQTRLAESYYRLLTSIDWSDRLLVAGLKEGLDKFLSNAHLSLYAGRNKYHKTHFISRSALAQLEQRELKGLVWEHLIPKQRYIQAPCEAAAATGSLTVDMVSDLINRYWVVATITTAEDRLLSRRAMPTDWNQTAVKARYQTAGIELIQNPYFAAVSEFALAGKDGVGSRATGKRHITD